MQLRSIRIPCLLSICLAIQLHAQTWTGVDSTWSNPDNDSFDVIYNNGDAVTFGNTGAGTVTTAAGGVAPSSILINNTSGSYVFTGVAGNTVLGGTGSLTHSGSATTEFQSTRTAFGDPSPFSFSGGTTLSGGILILKYALEEETLGFGTGGITLSNNARFAVEEVDGGSDSPTRIVTNNIVIDSTGGEIFTQRTGGNPSFTFSGTLGLGGNLTTGNMGGSGRAMFTNTVSLSDNVSIAGSRASFFGGFTGSSRTLSVTGSDLIFGDGDNAAGPSLSFDLGGLTVSGRMIVDADSNTSDVFSLITDTNGGAVTVQSGGRLTLQQGKFDLSELTLESGSILELDAGNSFSRLDLSDSPSFTVQTGRTLYHGVGNTQNSAELDVTIENGGTLVSGEAKKRRGILRGNLTLLDGATVSFSTSSNASEGGGYIIDDDNPADGIILGATATDSTITIEGGQNNRIDQTQTTVIQSNNITQNGNVTIRYESLRDDRWFKLGYDNVGDGDDTSNSVPISNPFLAGNHKTVFAPVVADAGETHGAGIMVLGPDAQNVFVTSSTTELVTEGTVVFWSANASGQARRDVTNAANNEGALGNVVLESGGSFDFVADGSIIMNTLTVDTGASISGTGTLDGDLIFNGGSLNIVLSSASTANLITMASDVSGTGLINVDNGGFTPTVGTIIEVIANGTYSGENLTANNGWEYIGNGQIQAIPEPSTLLLVVTAFAGAVFVRSRKR